jgi:hypothetical protein
MTSTYAAKLDGIAASANNYSHPTGDGNLHVPATSTTNDGKVLTAGATAGALSWTTPTVGTVTSVSGTSPVASSGGATPTISMTAAGAATSGYVTTGVQSFGGTKSFAKINIGSPSLTTRDINAGANGIRSEGHIAALIDKSLFLGPQTDEGNRIRLFATGGHSYFDYYDNLYFRSGSASSVTQITFSSTGNITAANFVSNVATGTAPYATTSTTLNNNLNADLIHGIPGRQGVQNISIITTTAIPFNVANGLDATLIMDADKTVTFSNLIAGDKGNIYITGGASINWTLTIAGYTVEIPAASHSTGDQVALSGATKNDLLVYWYTGTKLIVGLAKNLQ